MSGCRAGSSAYATNCTARTGRVSNSNSRVGSTRDTGAGATLAALQQCTAPGLLNCRAGSLAVARVEPTMHILAGLEGRDYLLGHRDPFTIARVAPGARVTPLDREHPKVTQLDPVTTRERGRDRVQDGVDDGLHIPLVQVRVLLRDPLDQFRLEHRYLSQKGALRERWSRKGSEPAKWG